MLDFTLDNVSIVEQERLKQNLLPDIPQDLAKDEVLAEWEKRTALAVVYTKPHFAYRLLMQLRQLLTQQNAEIKLKYQGVITWLYFAAVIDLAKEELVVFFREGDLGLILNEDGYNDLIIKIKSRLLLETLAERDLWREQIYNALHENQNKLSAQCLPAPEPGAAANWLKVYDGQIGLAPAESLALTQFTSRAAIEAKLNEQEKNILRRFFEFYEFIKLSSYDARAFEEDIVFTDEKGKTFLLADGQQIDLSEVESELKRSNRGSLVRIISEEPKIKSETATVKQMPLFQSVASEARRLLGATQGQVSAVLLSLGQALNEQRAVEALGALLLLAQLRALDDALGSDQNLLALVRADLKKAGLDDKVEGLRLNPTAPNFIARFLKVALQDKLNIAEAEALDFSQKLAQLLALEGEKYSRIVITGSDGRLKWNL